MPTALLPDRTVITVAGPEAAHFLQNILTTDLDALREGEAKPGALLSPQGKILFDFLAARTGGESFFLDCNATTAADFVKRLMLYRLRAKVEIAVQEQLLAHAAWETESDGSRGDSAASSIESGWLTDSRFPSSAHVRRAWLADAQAEAAPTDWDRLRIAHGVAESGSDFASGDAFPHDVLLDQNGGVGLRKGCYVGQEVVSRMQHRGTARRRVMIARGQADLPAGAEIRAGPRAIGTIGTVSGRDGLAIVRTDRVGQALAAGLPILAGDVAITLSIPSWATYTLPSEADTADSG